MHAIELNVWDRINSHEKTYTQHKVCFARLFIQKRRLFSFEIHLLLIYYFCVEIYGSRKNVSE